MSRNVSDLVPGQVRRIVTGHDERGASRVLWDAAATNRKYGTGGSVATLIWSSDRCPADIAGGADPEDYGARTTGTAPPARGSRFVVIDIPPGMTGSMHRTDSLDYVVVIAGTIDMDLDDGSVTLIEGDVMVQRGTNHSWCNRSVGTARVAFVLLDAEPLGIGDPLTGRTSAN